MLASFTHNFSKKGIIVHYVPKVLVLYNVILAKVIGVNQSKDLKKIYFFTFVWPVVTQCLLIL